MKTPFLHLVIAYLDESGNSSSAETITISGIVARAREWKYIDRHLKPRAMKGFKMPYPPYRCS